MSVFDLDQKGQQAIDEDARLNPLDVSADHGDRLRGGRQPARHGVMKGGRGRAIHRNGWSSRPDGRRQDHRPRQFQRRIPDGSLLRRAGFNGESSRDYWTPNHSEAGKAGQILAAYLRSGILYAVGRRKSDATAMMVAGPQAAGTGTDLAKQGIDGTTAGTVAAVQGFAYAGFKMPFLQHARISHGERSCR